MPLACVRYLVSFIRVVECVSETLDGQLPLTRDPPEESSQVGEDPRGGVLEKAGGGGAGGAGQPHHSQCLVSQIA